MTVVAVIHVAAPELILAPFFVPGEHVEIAISTNLLLVAAVTQFFDCPRTSASDCCADWTRPRAASASPSSAAG
ncbi:hypothetical protein [Streptomyces gobiensis]|uniref:hypothetical protein n=1 Tax=Streptomyces gobiensis TaxID=2875706 RepID=UPI001E45FBAD|nr:hypothetical protein [Streptomyces gobiensis]UGY92577.1 hypothetical protein test1122_13165 [Streptomyces gobiensis]